MSDLAIRAAGDGADGVFRPRTVALLLVIGILGFLGTLVLGAFAPDLRSGHNGGAHALSTAAVGFGGIVRLAEATGRNPVILRNDTLFDTEDLVVLTPETGLEDMGKILARRAVKPTLVILPKWATVADPDKTGWVREAGLVLRAAPEAVFAPQFRFSVSRHRSGGRPLRSVDVPPAIQFAAARPLQTIAGKELRPLITDDRGGIVLAQLGTRPLYVLADPDLLSNIGMADARQAQSALTLLDYLNSGGATSIKFDVTLNGFGAAPSPLKLAFEPPFLAMTLAVAIALMMVAMQALARFGPARRRERAIAFGKAALIDNTAALVRKAGREAALGRRYADVVRDLAVAAFGVPARLHDGAIDDYLDGLGGRERFSDLANQARDAGDRHAMLAAAQRLHRWKQEKGG
ncbi:hypothetical protein [Flavisphingomonas formosensis]|uniref:hypothetical protein n=1 Tax=Flavisphingomonas formosensis TaxID=861534 RepID=UPI0012F7A99D|nr:hypothetical protein [Sphingomonas formosensis]